MKPYKGQSKAALYTLTKTIILLIHRQTMAKLLHVVGTAANSAYEQDGRYGGEITMNGTAATLRFWAPGQTIADSNPSTNGNHNIAVTAGQVLNLSIPAGYRVTASASTLLSIDSTPYGASQLL